MFVVRFMNISSNLKISAHTRRISLCQWALGNIEMSRSESRMYWLENCNVASFRYVLTNTFCCNQYIFHTIALSLWVMKTHTIARTTIIGLCTEHTMHQDHRTCRLPVPEAVECLWLKNILPFQISACLRFNALLVTRGCPMQQPGASRAQDPNKAA